MMEQAQNMMRNMTPEQMAHMRQMMSQMSPEQMANMQRMAANMGMDSSPGTNPQSSYAAYQLSGARTLKDDGNALHKGGNHSAAILKYNQALEKLALQSSAEAIALQTSCELNKAMCHLKLEQWRACEDICSQVLQRETFFSLMLFSDGHGITLYKLSEHSTTLTLCRRAKSQSTL